jgi:hypothetical protein
MFQILSVLGSIWKIFKKLFKEALRRFRLSLKWLFCYVLWSYFSFTFYVLLVLTNLRNFDKTNFLIFCMEFIPISDSWLLRAVMKQRTFTPVRKKKVSSTLEGNFMCEHCAMNNDGLNLNGSFYMPSHTGYYVNHF